MKTLIIVVVIILIAIGAYFLVPGLSDTFNFGGDREKEDPSDITLPGDGEDERGDDVPADEGMTVLGKSAGGRDITAYHYGNGDTELLLVGGIHGGYSWNTALVAFEAMDYLEANPDVVPANVTVTVVPVLNPDGLNKVVGTSGRFSEADVPDTEAETIPGRFNGNNVDLNRNFDCDWQTEGVWQNTKVDGGSAAFSEPESKAIRNYINSNTPDAVVVWYSAVGGVFASNCHNGVLEETRTLTNTFAKASGYKAYEEFNFYEITGDMVNWLAKEEIPGISVLLTTHSSVEWDKNKKGIDALLEYYGN